MTIPGKLTVARHNGTLIGPATIAYNTPWPCANGTPGGGANVMMGVVMHTEVGFEQATIDWFNNPASQASAFFAIGQDGAIHQFGPVGKNWMAWTQSAGNPMWYGIEDADQRDPSIPLTDAQITAFAQILECLSAFAGFPLQLTDHTDVKGLGWHGMGGVPWGNHPDCPGDVRKAQRGDILKLALEIRHGAEVVHCPKGVWTALPGSHVRPIVHDVVLAVQP